MRWLGTIPRATLIGFGACLCIVAALVIYSARTKRATSSDINARLSALRAQGEPISVGDLAKRFPDPPPNEEAELVFARVFSVTTNLSWSATLPLIGTAALPTNALTPLDSATTNALDQLCRRSSAMWQLFPSPWPEHVRFGIHWGDAKKQSLPFVPMRSTAKALVAHALYAAERNDSEEAARAIVTLLRFGRAISYDGYLVGHMIRHAIDGLTAQAFERCLNRVRFSDGQLGEIAAAIQDEPSDAFLNCLRAEHVMAISALSGFQFRTNSGFSFSNDETVWQRMVNRVRFRKPTYVPEDFVLFLETVKRELDIARLPALEAVAAAKVLRTNTVRRMRSLCGEMSVSILLDRGLPTHVDSQTKFRVMAEVVAAKRHRLAHSNDAAPLSLFRIRQNDPVSNQLLRFRALAPAG